MDARVSGALNSIPAVFTDQSNITLIKEITIRFSCSFNDLSPPNFIISVKLEIRQMMRDQMKRRHDVMKEICKAQWYRCFWTGIPTLWNSTSNLELFKTHFQTPTATEFSSFLIKVFLFCFFPFTVHNLTEIQQNRTVNPFTPQNTTLMVRRVQIPAFQIHNWQSQIWNEEKE